MPVSLQKEDKC